MIADLIDMMLWDMSHPDKHPIDEYLTELRARSDADTPDIKRAIAVLVDYQKGCRAVGVGVKRQLLSAPFGITPKGKAAIIATSLFSKS